MRTKEEIKQLFDKIENLDWMVIEEGYSQYLLSQFSPAEQDFNIVIEGKNVEELLESIYQAYENYDVSEETYLWLDNTGHGKNGAPYELEDVLEDMKWCKNAILELYKNLTSE